MTNMKIWTNRPELLDIEECLPQPAHKFFPQWWKNAPAQDPPAACLADQLLKENLTIKSCPAVQEFLTEGIIIPLWCDVYLKADTQGNWAWLSPNPNFKWETHKANQFVNHALSWIKEEISVVFKAHSPWFIKTPPGYSVHQMPLFYHFNTNYTLLMGTIQTDVHHVINQQVLFHSKEKELVIKRGTPFAWYIPFKREEYSFSVVPESDQERAELNSSVGHVNTKFWGGYRAHSDKICPMKKTD